VKDLFVTFTYFDESTLGNLKMFNLTMNRADYEGKLKHGFYQSKTVSHSFYICPFLIPLCCIVKSNGRLNFNILRFVRPTDTKKNNEYKEEFDQTVDLQLSYPSDYLLCLRSDEISCGHDGKQSNGLDNLKNGLD
jgi:hypothetical protein